MQSHNRTRTVFGIERAVREGYRAISSNHAKQLTGVEPISLRILSEQREQELKAVCMQ